VAPASLSQPRRAGGGYLSFAGVGHHRRRSPRRHRRPDDQVDENIELAGWDYRAFHRELAATLREIEADR
tara:strand:+ start:982 stop:1191 length:210 start_codon:yes stop_codon:yes gene_type:complete